jgi:hypothetical protein
MKRLKTWKTKSGYKIIQILSDRSNVFPPFANDVKQIIESWGKLLETNCSIYIPSHGTADDRLLVQNDYYNRIMKIWDYDIMQNKLPG